MNVKVILSHNLSKYHKFIFWKFSYGYIKKKKVGGVKLISVQVAFTTSHFFNHSALKKNIALSRLYNSYITSYLSPDTYFL